MTSAISKTKRIYIPRSQRSLGPPEGVKASRRSLNRDRSYQAWIRRGFLPIEAWLLVDHRITLSPKTDRQKTLVRRLVKVRRKLITTWQSFGFSTREIYNFLYDLVENPIIGDNLEAQLKAVGSDPNEPDASALRPYSSLLRSREDVERQLGESIELGKSTFGVDNYKLFKEDSSYWEELAQKRFNL